MSETIIDPLAAFETVKNAVSSLRQEHKTLCAEISVLEERQRQLPFAPVPLADMKAAILELIDSSGRIHADEVVKEAISTFATGGNSAGHIEGRGKPLSFKNLEMATSGQSNYLSRHRFVTGEQPPEAIANMAFYCFFADLVKQRLACVMQTMTEEDFGYRAIHPDKVGTDRAARRAEIALVKAQLEEKNATKKQLEAKLAQLGVSVGAMKD